MYQSASPSGSQRRTPSSSEEVKVYGFNACMALWENRAAAIIRVYVTEERMRQAAGLLKWCARQKIAYHVMTPADMERVAHSVHHEGLMILAAAQVALDDAGLAQQLARLTGPCCLLYLDGVQNPHNVGSITRVAAHFGTPLIIGRRGQLPRLGAAASRVAEGGVEHVGFALVDDPAKALAQLRAAGFTIVATSSHARASLYSAPLPARTVLILGGEVEGASASLLDGADDVRQIPGTGKVESLNVAVAAGLCLGEFWRAHGEAPRSRM